jgi:hypothetical protein
MMAGARSFPVMNHIIVADMVVELAKSQENVTSGDDFGTLLACDVGIDNWKNRFSAFNAEANCQWILSIASDSCNDRVLSAQRE